MADSDIDDDEHVIESQYNQEEEEDDMVGQSPMREDDDEDYAHSDDGDEDQETKAEEEVPAGMVNAETYILSNRVAYSVPLVDADSGVPGRVRDYGDVVEVDDAAMLGNMRQLKNWPHPENIPATAIVIVKARMKEGDTVSTNKNEGPFVWYARVVIKGKRDGPDSKILRHIPKPVVKSIRSYLADHELFNRSSLLNKFIPHDDNKSEFAVIINGWSKVAGIKSEAAQKKAEPKPEPKDEAKAAGKRTVAEVEEEDAGSPSVLSRKAPSKKAVEPPRLDPPRPAPEQPKEKPSKKQESSKSVAPKPDPSKVGLMRYGTVTKKSQEPPEKTEAPVEAPASEPPRSGEASCSTDSTRVESDQCEFKVKRARVMEVENADRTHVFWKDNKMHVIES